jgi:hypothetical protein
MNRLMIPKLIIKSHLTGFWKIKVQTKSSRSSRSSLLKGCSSMISISWILEIISKPLQIMKWSTVVVRCHTPLKSMTRKTKAYLLEFIRLKKILTTFKHFHILMQMLTFLKAAKSTPRFCHSSKLGSISTILLSIKMMVWPRTPVLS